MPGFSLNASSVRSGGAHTWHGWEVAVRTAMRALLLAVVLVVLPASIAYCRDPGRGAELPADDRTTTSEVDDDGAEGDAAARDEPRAGVSGSGADR